MLRECGTLLVLALSALPLPAQERPGSQAPTKPTAEQAWQRLKDGNARFVADQPLAPAHARTRAETAKGQKPFAVILACSDSRTGPELVFDQGLGELFVVRVAGNVTDPVVLGSIEYAVGHLHVPLVVVLGHEHCGAVAAAIQGGPAKGNLGELIKHVYVGASLPADHKEAVAAGVRVNARHQAAALTGQSVLIRAFERSGRVRIVTGIQHLDSGRVQWLEAPPRPKAKPAHSSP